jgi:two-component system cell cycle sensor histidine kinase/response regulator CckA
MRVGEGEMSDRSAGLAGGLGHRSQDAFPTAAAAEPRSRVWLAILLFGAVAVGLYYAPFLDPNWQAVVYVAIEAIAVAIVFASLRLNRPARPLAWALFGAGMLSTTLGDVVWYWLSLVQNVSPTTSLADVFYLGEYPLLIAGIILLVRARPDRGVVLDTLIITTGVSVVVLEFVVRPYLESFTGSALDLAVLVAYPLADVALLAVLVRSALTGNLRSPVLRLLVAGLAVLFFADVLYLWLSQMNPDFDLNTSPIDAAWPMSMFIWAAAAMHPAARTELSGGGMDWIQQNIARRLLLAGALLLLPATLVVEAASGANGYTPVWLAASGIIVVLVILRMESALSVARHSEERFRIIFEDSPAGMAIARRGLIVLVNSTVRSIFRVGQSNVRTMSLTDFIAPGHRQELIDRIERRAHGERLPEEFQTVGVRADGSQFPLVVGTHDIFLPDGPATIGFLLDVSARKAAEEAIRASERRYRDLFESNPHPMWIYDSETLRFLAVNDTAVEEYGWSVEQFRAMTITDIRPPEDVPQLAAILIHKAEVPTITQTRHFHADGSITQVEVTSHEIAWDGRPARVVLATDLTEKVKLEEQLRQAQKMEAVGRLAGGIAHDFNNLLTAISGNAQLLRSELEPGDARVEEVDEILLAGERAATLTRQLLAFSRRQVLQPRALNLNESIDELRSMLGRLIGEDVLLRTVLEPDLGLVRADPGQLTQVLVNLAVNARDAMPKGGTVTIETRNVMLDRTFAAAHEGVQPGPHVMLGVSDTGAGMDAETQAHLFEPFFTTKEVGKGTGLGLATVYGIVRQSEGSIDIRSEPGKGSTFEICLPQAPVGERVAAGQVPIATLQRGHETILVVEDEASVRKLAISVLERQGYGVLAAEGPGQAEAIAAEHPGRIDLLLTDVVMPGGNGVDLAARLSALRPAMKVLLMTGYAQDTIADQGGLKDGIVLIEKPFSPNLLLARVRMAIDAEARSTVAGFTDSR